MQVEVGSIVDGKVTGIAAFGAFVELSDGRTGLVHISEVSTEYVDNIKDHLKDGQEVKVKVVSIDQNGKIALSIKKTQENENNTARPRASAPRGDRFGKSNYSGNPREKKNSAPLTFEDKLMKFKQDSDEKMQDLKRNTDGKRGGGYKRAY